MADKQESALTQQSDCKWVRALDANGNSIRISKEDLAAVVGGLLPLASKEQNGLMSKSDKIIQFKNIKSGNYPLFKIVDSTGYWSRNVSFIYGCNEGVPFAFLIGLYVQDGITPCRVFIKWLTEKDSKIKIYRKDAAIYLYINNMDSAPNVVFIQSSTGFELVSNGITPDESYTLID